eukprot:4563453-Pleurochrysis_carterae.AAC.2
MQGATINATGLYSLSQRLKVREMRIADRISPFWRHLVAEPSHEDLNVCDGHLSVRGGVDQMEEADEVLAHRQRQRDA